MLIFENPGLIDITAMTVTGVSVKDDKNPRPIGQFGTGLKYAIAIVLRLGGRVEVWRGKRLYVFGVREKTIRGKKFKIVTMNDRDLGYTDQMGLHWEPWMAYRELWSNCKDEAGTTRRYDDDTPLIVNAKSTKVIVWCAELEKVHDERYKIIMQTEPLVVLPGLEIHAGTAEYVYYRGIRIAETPGKKKSVYTYNLTADQTLTEDRTLAYTWSLPGKLAAALVQCTNMAILHDVLGDSQRDMLEGHLPWSDQKDQKPSPQFMEVAEQLQILKKLNGSAGRLFNEYRDTMPGYISPYLVQPSAMEEETIAKAISLVARAGLTITRASLMFKSKLSLGRVQATVRDGMIIDHAVLHRGALPLAAAIVEGLASMAGGSATEQLALYVVHRSFAPVDERGRGLQTVGLSDDYTF